MGSRQEIGLANGRPFLVVVTGLQGTGKSTAAEHAAGLVRCPVLAHDWAMSGLRPFPAVQAALDRMDPPAHRVVGWSILLALARAQLRAGRSVVLDGMAARAELGLARELADEEGATMGVVLTECDDLVVQRARIEGRARNIPNWYEVDWDHVQRSRARWEAPHPVDLVLAATDHWPKNAARLEALMRRLTGPPARPPSSLRSPRGVA